MLSKRRQNRAPGCAPAAVAWEAACPAGRAGLATSSLSAVTRLLAGCCMVPAALFLEGPADAVFCPALQYRSSKGDEQQSDLRVSILRHEVDGCSTMAARLAYYGTFKQQEQTQNLSRVWLAPGFCTPIPHKCCCRYQDAMSKCTQMTPLYPLMTRGHFSICIRFTVDARHVTCKGSRPA